MTTHWFPGNADLPTSGVTAGTYGDATHVGQVTVAASGLVTAASSVAITGGGGGGGGGEIGYDQITSFVAVTSTTEASPTTVITCSAYTFDGAPVICQMFSPFFQNPSTGIITITLWEGASQITRLGIVSTGSAVQFDIGTTYTYRFTPSAGSHTYLVRGFVASTSGTPGVGAGTGAGADYPPAFARFTKV
jgi:hypothetical protein